MYTLTVEKKEKNENYEKELEKTRYEQNPFDAPKKENIIRSLQVTLSEEEFQAVKKAVLAEFK